MRGAHISRNPRPVRRSRGLFKPDRPRAIDHYIDYFGGAGSYPDLGGEVLLDSLEREADAAAVNLARGLASNG